MAGCCERVCRFRPRECLRGEATAALSPPIFLLRRYAAFDGQYWLPGYRFAPAWPADPEPWLLNAERVVVIDQNISAIDVYHAHVLANEAARRYSARLSLLLDIGLYMNPRAGRSGDGYCHKVTASMR